MIYGYLRVSSDAQDVNSQKQGVDKFASDRGWTIDEYITDEGVSGGKDPDKRNLGPLLKKLQKDDIVIAAEISRLGRDLYMVMDILHFCMTRGCIIYTVKDRFTLGDDIQSKVLAFAFGLAAEIERQMIRQRTQEGLRLRVKMGVLLGRPPCALADERKRKLFKKKEQLVKMHEWGFSQREIARRLKVDRNTVYRYLTQFCSHNPNNNWTQREREYHRKHSRAYQALYKDGELCIVPLPREQVKDMILRDMTIPQIHAQLPQYTYEQLYDSIYCDDELNLLYREHAQKLIKSKRKHV